MKTDQALRMLIRVVWSEFSPGALAKFLHADNENWSDRSHNFIRIFTGRIFDNQGCRVFFFMRKVKTLMRRSVHTGWLESSLGAYQKVRFLKVRLICDQFLYLSKVQWILYLSKVHWNNICKQKFLYWRQCITNEPQPHDKKNCILFAVIWLSQKIVQFWLSEGSMVLLSASGLFC